MLSAKQHYVYLLVDPRTDKIFYVGKGKGKRCQSHLAEYKKGIITNDMKFRCIDSIIKSGNHVIIKKVAENLTESTAYDIEMNLIKSTPGLSNIKNGTSTNEQRATTKAKAMLSRMIPFENWMSLKPRPAFHIELYHNAVKTLNIVAYGR